MQKVISSEELPIKLWLDYIEDGALAQAKNLANLPFAFKHIAIMSDSHQGYGMPIGGVLATKGVVIPNAVGKDIGCGMLAVRTSLTGVDTEVLKKIMGSLRKVIPVGFNHNKERDYHSMPYDVPEFTSSIVREEFESAQYQIGSLGGGNHFIEIQKGDDGFIWIMLHSGSRNLGLKVADYYNKVAIESNSKYYSSVPKEWDLAFLPLESISAFYYLKEMQYCVDFAHANRDVMMHRITGIIDDEFSGNVSFDSVINVAHNYARLEHHFGQEVIVHRKGATSSKEGELGIIPGSQGSKSYIVKGKGNKESFESCSHGAGRRMGRKEAERSLNLEDEIKNLDDRGILHAIRSVKDLDEAPGAYKNIDVVMKNQADLVSIEVELTPLGVIKA